MPKFIPIGYGNREGYDRTPEPLRDASHAHDKVLRDWSSNGGRGLAHAGP